MAFSGEVGRRRLVILPRLCRSRIAPSGVTADEHLEALSILVDASGGRNSKQPASRSARRLRPVPAMTSPTHLAPHGPRHLAPCAPPAASAERPGRGARRAAGRLRRGGLRHRAAGARCRRPAQAAGDGKRRRRADRGPAGSPRRASAAPVSQRAHAQRATRPKPAAPPGRRRSRGGRLPAQRPDWRRRLFEAAPARWCRRARRQRARSSQLVARYRPSAASSRDPLHAADDRARRRARFGARIETAPLLAARAARQRHGPHLALRRHRRGRHPRCGGDADGRDFLDRHRLPPRAAQGRHASAWSTRRSKPTASRCLAATGGRPRALRRIRQQRHAATRGVWFQDAGAARAPTSASTARASAAPSSPARWSSRASPAASRCASTRSCTVAAPPGRRLCRADRHAGAHVGDGVVEFAGAAERLRQRGASSSTTTTRTTVYAHLSRIDVQPRPERRAGREHRRRRRHRLGHRAAPALRVPRQRRAPRSAGDRQVGRRRATDRGRRQGRASSGWPAPCARSSMRPRHTASAPRWRRLSAAGRNIARMPDSTSA